MNYRRAARKALSGLLSAMMVVTQMSNNFTTFAEEIPVDEPAPEVASTPVETTEEPTPEAEAPPTEEVIPEQPAEVTPEPEADPVENPEPSETEQTDQPEDPEKEEQEEKEEKEPNVRTVYEGYGEGVSVSVTLTDPEAIADDAVLNLEFIPTEDPTELIYDIYFTEDKEEEGVVKTNLKSGSATVVMTFSASQLTDIIQATDNADLVLFDGNGAVLPSVTSIADQRISYTVTSVGKVRIFNQNYPKEETEEEKSDEEEKEEEEEAHSRTLYTATGDGVQVTAVLDDAAAIPDDAELSVYKVSESDTAIAYDISFVGPEKDEEGNATGNMITFEPTNGSVSVTMQFLEGQLTQNLGVQSADQVEVVHLPSTAMPEAVGANVSVEAETVSFALTSFSVVIIGKSWENPELFAPPAGHQNYSQNGGTYHQGDVIQYLLQNYGVVTSGNANLDTHTMAAILVGGNLTGRGSGFADDVQTAKNVSSYVKGSVENFSGTSASRAGNTDLAPLYLGTVNRVEGVEQTWNDYIVWGKYRYNSTDSSNVGNPVYITDDYVDFNRLYQVIREESQQLLVQGSSGRPIVEGRTLTITAGQYVTIPEDMLANCDTINIIGNLEDATNTIINLPQSGTINLPRVLINGSQPAVQEAGAGTAFVWNMPNATDVNVPTQNWVGHIIAPDAKITQKGGNYNGGFICRELDSDAEGHTYQYNGGKLISDETGFSAAKTIGTGVWPEGVTFQVNFTADNGGPLPPSPTVTLSKSSPEAEFGDVVFNPITPSGEIVIGQEYEWDVPYVYTIQEVDGGNANIEYDLTPRKLRLTVHYYYKKLDASNEDKRATITLMEQSPDGGNTWFQLTTHSAYTFAFQNNDTRKTKANIEARKMVVGASEWKDDWQFEFKLAALGPGTPMPASDTAYATKSNQAAIFSDIEYTKTGTYSYKLWEVEPAEADKIPGVTYDTTEHIVNVIVEDVNGTMVATVDYDTGVSLYVTNKYEEVKAAPEVTKDFNDWGKADSFTFDLAAGTNTAGVTTPMPSTTTVTATEDEPTASFGDIVFLKEGTYNYTITERNDGVDGVSYDTTPHNVKIVVDRDDDNQLRATVTYDNQESLTVTNTYSSTKAHFEAEKEFDSWGKANSFTFNLAAVTPNAPMPSSTSAVASQNNPVAVFGDITFEKAGTYEYTITEVNDGVDGVTYDTTPHAVKVVVSKANDATNALTAKVTYDDEDSLVITNTFKDVKATIEATKDFNDWGKADSFTFNLVAASTGAPMPASTTATATQANPLASFGEITYEKAGVYRYTITEVNDHVDGVTYDTNPHEVVVTVTKDPTTNELTAEVKYDGADSLIITNTYSSVDAELEATKSINDWGDAEKFTFNIAAVGDAPAPAVSSADATRDDPTANFGSITFEKAGTYEYTITEVDDGVDGVTYDTNPHKATVTVTADPDTNKLTASVKYDDTLDALTITNRYASSNAVIQATKQFNDWGKADSFTFTLTRQGGPATPMPAGVTGNSVTATATKDNPTAVFGQITYRRTGTYRYTIVETDDHVAGVTYDTTPHNVVVTVTRQQPGNRLVAEVKYDDQDALIITNTFTSTKAHFEAEKEFDDWGKADSFTFDLAAVTAGAPMPSSTTATATEVNPTAVFGDMEFDAEGVYEYTITERNGGADGVTYDTTPHTATVTVTKNATTNALEATVSYGDDSTLIITNTYTTVKKNIEVTKEFNDWGKADSFTFILAPLENAPMPANNTAVATEANPTAVFDEIEYESTGSYRYTITEVNDHADGVTYDTAPHYAEVIVTKDADNKMSAEVKYDNSLSSLTITNTYTSVEENLHATKAFDDWGKAESFEFILAPVGDAPMPARDSKTATETNKMVTFGPITYEKAGTYEYTITEVNGGADGVTYDTTPHTVTVTVTADPDTNELSTDVKYDTDNTVLIITNTFEATKAHFEATKEFNDWGKATSFRFTVEAGDNDAGVETPMPAANTAIATQAKPTAVFEEITFEKAGTYNYTITEINDGADGVTYDTTPHNVVVTVTKADDDTNALSAEVTYDGAESLIITNTYTSTKTTIEATKEFEDWGKADSFTFVLEPVTENAPMPEGSVNGKKTAVATEANPTAVFGEITYERGGTYKYTITEVNDGADGVTYDTTPHEVIVMVNKDPATNALSAYAIYDGAESLIITNTYKGTEATIEAEKEFEDWGKADSFTFKLAAVTPDAPMPASDTAVATEDEPLASFGTIKYEKAGEYKYTITEQNDGADGVTYDTTPHEVIVTVTKDPDTNELSASVTYDGEESLIITNTYAGTETTLEATKQFNDWGKADSFTFNIVPVGDAPAPEKDSAVATEAEPVASFGTVKFEKAGTYEYTITEVDDGVDGVTYDTTPHKAVVTVTKEEGTNKLTASVKYDDKDSLIITNKYDSEKATIQATKAFEDWGKADSFTFNLAAIDGAPMPANDSVTVTKDAPTGVFGEIEYEKAGTYKYTITEVNDHVDGVTYDETPHEVVVTVTKGEGNKLVAEVKYDGEDALIITNTYESTKATIEATKEFNDWGKAESFTFKLAAIDGAPMPASDTATATEAAPLASFGEIEYEKSGTYKYTITEVNDHVDGVTYDETPHEVVVTVTADPDTNELSVEVTYDGEESLIITNEYTSVEEELHVTKAFEDWGKADSFTFDLAPITEGAPMPAVTEATATEDAKMAKFGPITFEKSGTYEYTITERDDGADGVTYDTAPHRAIVTVTADPDTNELKATVAYDDGASALIITNTYETAKTHFEAEKEFEDWGKATSFTFTLAPVGDAPMPASDTATATEADPIAKFEDIEFEKAGTYEYTITEVNDHVDGVTYDETAHKVVVEVTKGQGNKLEAVVTYDGAESLIITNTYTTTKAVIEATKEFNDWGKAQSFEFTLAPIDGAPMPAKDSATATEAEPTAVFGEIEYEKAGTYKYTITEINDHVDGVTYDETPHEVIVTVTADPDTNELSAEVTYDGEASLIITNTYTSVEDVLHATKAFEDWGKADSFTFDLAPIGDAPMPAVTEATATEDAKMVTFGPITFEKAGTYQYTITERDDGADGVTYDTTAHTATVVVTADPDTNELSTKVTYDNDSTVLIITNTYETAKTHFEAEKEFEDWGKADSFTFKLAAIDGAPMPASDTAVATEADPIAKFGDIEFEKSGTYEYTITEVNDHVDGVTYDETAHKVVVEVTKGEGNVLSANVTYDDAETLIITNTYTTTKAVIEATKEFNDWGKATSFTFNLAAVTPDAPMPAKTSAVATEAEPVASFGEIEFEKSGTYKYTITEVNDGVDGVTYDTTAHQVVVEVTADPDTNELSAKVTYDGQDSLIITNTYEATEAEIEATKQFNDWGQAESFTFKLAPIDDAPMPASDTAVATATQTTASFGSITFEASGTYEYTITEVDDGVDGVTYDTTPHKVVVTVTKEEGTNKLSATVKYDDADMLIITNKYASEKAVIQATKAFDDWGKAEAFEFHLAPVGDAPMPAKDSVTVTKDNKTGVFGEIEYKQAGTYEYTITEVNDHVDGVTYDTTPHKVVVEVTKTEGNKLVADVKYDDADSLIITNTYTSTKAPIEATKEFNDWGKASSFTFNLAAVTADAPMPASTTATATEAEPLASFGEITFEKSGTYQYTITEVNDGVDGVTYDTAEHLVVVEVTADPDTNELSAVVKYDGEDSLIITNTYEGTETTLEATKQFNDWGAADSFTFNITPVGSAPAPEKSSAVATEAAPTASFGTVKFEKAGTYEYIINEVDDGVDGVTYDTSDHKAVVTVTKEEGTNKLSATVKYDDADSLIITNKYASSKAIIQATKKFDDWGKADSFTFNLEAIGDAPMPAKDSVTVTEDAPTGVFGEIEYKKAGTYEYTITEVNDGVDGVTYDTAPHKVVVEVTKGTDNKLTAEVKYDGEDALIITNTYEGTETTLEATKQFNDWGAADSFTFNIAPVGDAPAPEKATAIATEESKTASFGTVKFEKSGTYEYIITEVDDGVDGVTYDTSEHKAVVTVTKEEGTNKLSASVKYDDKDSLIITNNYASEKAVIQATKAFEDWGKADSFTFNLTAVTEDAPMPEKDSVVVTEDAPTGVFGEIEYKKAGTYVYTITEVNDGVDGVTYDTTPHAVVVEVVKTEGNKMVATVTYDGEPSLIITNTYEGTEATLEATKEFNDWGAADSFTFNIAPVGDAPAPESTSAVATEDAPTASFGTVKFEKAGTYEYIITEVDDGVDGVTYDTSEHKAVVTVTKEEGTNKLSASVLYDGKSSLIITNTYESTKAEIEATKEFNDWGKAASFTFTLKAIDDAPMPASDTATATEAQPLASFGEIEYRKAGTYEYTITEVNDHVDGVTYDTTEHKVVVEVTKGEGNKLSAEVKYDGAESLIITNTYASTEATIEATKEFNDWGKADSFTFNLEAVTPDAPMPASTSAVATEAEPKASFGTITYEKSGTYTYTITEVNDGADGVTYDTTAHQVVVEVTADPDTNELSATVKYDGADSLIITNTYEGTETTLEATKQFNDWAAADSFTFNIAPVGDAPAPEKASAIATEAEKTASFGTVKFEKAGTYEYIITEVDDGVDGVTYDTSEHKAVVTVTKEEGTNKLSAAVKYDDQDALIITNSYASEKATIQVTKAFEDWGKADSFTFNLEAQGEAPMPEKDSVTVTKEAPTGDFGTVEYKKAGTYEYTITEVNDHVDGVTYDTTEHKVVVEVKKTEGNKLVATVTYDGAESLIVTNTYTSTSATIEATKEFNDWGKANSFTFKLAAVDGAPMPASDTAVATEAAPKAVFEAITFEKAGTYKYTLTEVNDGVDGVTYDTEAHEVVVEVTADPDTNELSAEVKYDGAKSLVITNTFTAATAHVEATKEIDYWGKDGEFTFTFDLAAVTEDAPMPAETSVTVTKADPKAVFGDMTFDKAGTYQYTITEKDEGLKGVTYDTAAHAVTVEVTKDPTTNELSAAVTYEGQDALTITNKYEAKGEYEFGGIKTLTGRELEDAEFSFTLTGDKGVDQTVTNKGETFTFAPIEFTLEDLEKNADGTYKDGTFKYTIKEVAGDAKGVTYDKTEYVITLTVSDKGDGTLEVTADKTIEETKFENTYKQDKGKGKFSAKKILTGNQKLKDQQFTFEFKDDKGNVQTKKNDASGNVQFDEIEYEETGEYVYTVTEVNDGQKDVIYDNSVYTITVKVEDGEDGVLKVTSVITKGGQVVDGIVFHNATTPNTGVHNGTAFLTGTAAASLAGIALLEYLRRRQKNSKK